MIQKKVLNSQSHSLTEISKIIKESKTFFIASHIKPDGDGLGSCLAFASFLSRIKKKAKVYCKDDIPSNLKFLKGSDKIKKAANKTDIFDCAIILESTNFARMGDIIAPSQAKKIINIDHHKTHTKFGDINYIVPESSSTAELILNIFNFMKVKLTKPEAECLYTGIVTDTGRFGNTNTTINSFMACIDLMKYKMEVNKINKQIYGNSSLAALKLQGLALCCMKEVLNGNIAYTVLTKEMFKKSKANYTDSDGIVGYTLQVQGAKVGCLFKEIDKNATKVSMRSVKEVNLLNIVKQFGGGGHKNAAACVIKASIDKTVKLICNALKENINA